MSLGEGLKVNTAYLLPGGSFCSVFVAKDVHSQLPLPAAMSATSASRQTLRPPEKEDKINPIVSCLGHDVLPQ